MPVHPVWLITGLALVLTGSGAQAAPEPGVRTPVAGTMAAPSGVGPGDPGSYHRPIRHPLVVDPAALTDPDEAPPAAGGVLVGAITVAGADPLPQVVFMPVVQRFVGRHLTGDDLSALATAVASLARDRGYAFARAHVAAQAVDAGLLVVTLDLGRIDRVALTGEASPAIRAILAPLVGHPPTRAELERRIALVNDLPGVTLDHVQFAQVDGKGVLSGVITHKPAGITATLDNRGQNGLGPLRLAIGYQLNGLLNDDRLSLAGTLMTTPAHVSEQVVGGLRLAYVTDDRGSEIAVSGTMVQTRPGGALTAYDLASQARFADITYTRPLLRSRSTSLWVTARAAFVSESQFAAGVQVESDRDVLLSLAMNGFTDLGGGQLRGGLALSRLTGLGVPLGLPGSDDATIAALWLNWQRALGARWGLRLAMNAQGASAPLPLYNQIVLGGPNFGRAYDIGERTGDDGVLGLAEAQYNLITRAHGMVHAAQVYGFVDGGVLTVLGPLRDSDTALSGGVGSRMQLGDHMALEFEAAWPINQPRMATGTYSPRLSTSLNAAF